MLRYDAECADIDVHSLITNSRREGVAILAWGSQIPRAGDVFEYVEDGTTYLVEALKFHPRPPTARMRRHYRRPDYWLTVRLRGIAALYEEDGQQTLPFADVSEQRRVQ